MVIRNLCDRCAIGGQQEGELLRDILRTPGRSVREMDRQIDRYESIEEKAIQQMRKRLDEQKKRLSEYERERSEYDRDMSFEALERILQGEKTEDIVQRLSSDKRKQELDQMIDMLRYQSEEVEYRDVEEAMKEAERAGLVQLEDGRVKITSRGARMLARQALGKAMENLAKREMGSHLVKETGFGSELSLHSRPYELGDQYECIDIEKTLSNAVQRNASSGLSSGVTLEPQDFEVLQLMHQTRVCAGVIIDQSGSMQADSKIEAAMEASLALSELMMRNPKDELRVFIFSAKVEEIRPWDIVNVTMGKGSTDIRMALSTFRKATVCSKGDKQAYLITDAEPNTLDGAYVGFEKAVAEVVQEAVRCRAAGITLNIIMLDQRPALREFARILAQKNVGRILFASPGKLGAVMVEDYLKVKAGGSK